ncbi:MAG: N-acetylglucosamine-6-phosphate deacetylase [Lachnospiraceae bacterium]|nr:N-acetylglucosamine-6-phosphate deacetylase [Lachnospiraceae bacterium]
MLVLKAEIFLNGKFLYKDMRIQHGKITQFSRPGEMLPEPGEEVISAEGKRILPGLVDIHTHGRSGEDFSLADRQGLERLCRSYAACGVTSVLATVMTNEPDKIERAVRYIGDYHETAGAKLLGIHLEGPFLGKEKRGAHDEQYLRKPDMVWFQKLQKLGRNRIRLITLDPSLPGAEELIRYCQTKQVKVSLGHTACSYETARMAAEAGADHVTHLFNAMAPLHHREPGLIGAALDSGMYLELICDGIHLHPSLVRLLFTASPDKVLLISDSMPAAGCPDGMYKLGGKNVYVTDGKAVQADGTIAGSTVSLFEAMVNAIRFGIPAEAAVYSSTHLPAESIGMEQQTGNLAAGRPADFLIVSEHWELEQVYINGEKVMAGMQ